MTRLISTSLTHKPVDPNDPTGGMTLDALMLRQKQLQQQKPEAPAQIASPWQGFSLMANTFANNMQQNEAMDQEKAGREALAAAMQKRDPVTGQLAPDAMAQILKLDPTMGAAIYDREDQQAFELQKEKQKQAAEAGYKTTDISGLRQDVISDPSYKNLSQAAPIWSSMQDASTRKSPQAHLNLVIGAAKLFDPTSVVRTQEGEQIIQTGGLPASIWSGWQFLKGNPDGTLPDDVVRGLMQEGASRMRGYSDAYRKTGDFYRKLSLRHGVDPLDVVPDFELNLGEEPQQEDPTKKPPVPVPGSPTNPGAPTVPNRPSRQGPPQPAPDDVRQFVPGQTYVDKAGNVATYNGGNPNAQESWTTHHTAGSAP